MGGPGSGLKPDAAKRRKAAELRAQGLGVTEIARRLGLTRQCVHDHLLAVGAGAPRRGVVRCRECSAGIATGHHNIESNRRPLCLACVERRPDSPFGVRLKACRLAAGLTVEQLAARSGVTAHAIHAAEGGCCWPRWERVARLIRALGPELMTLGLLEQGAGKRGRAGS
jgi:DNA-binding XRE family transcriptional regulator